MVIISFLSNAEDLQKLLFVGCFAPKSCGKGLSPFKLSLSKTTLMSYIYNAYTQEGTHMATHFGQRKR